MIILAILVIGMAVGWLAALILGRPATHAQHLIAGILGSFVGGTAANILAGDGIALRASGLLGSLLGAIAVLLVWRPREA
jgi:uncharacterized membrane protein YeaQ/YmgE (transglycosylase-associated protein family)